MVKKDLTKKIFSPIPVPAKILASARALRHRMTDAEQLLWHCLRQKQLGGFRFRKQHPVARFVLDFYCCEARLAVELDGGQHNEDEDGLRDAERAAILAGRDIRVLRFWNHEVLTDPEAVLQKIFDVLLERVEESPLPTSPRWGEE